MFLSSYHPEIDCSTALCACFLLHDGCVNRAVSTGWVASCHTSRPSSEGRATSFSRVHKRNGKMFVISESSAHFCFFSWLRKQKKNTRPACLPAIAPFFLGIFSSRLKSSGRWKMLVLPWVPTGEQPSPWVRKFGRWFSLPKKTGSLPFGVETNHQFIYIPKQRLI